MSYLSRKHNYILKAAKAREKRIVKLVTPTVPAPFTHSSRTHLKQPLLSSGLMHFSEFSPSEMCSSTHLAGH